MTQLILPKNCLNEVIKQIHSSVYNGHLGKSKTTNKIVERFYRPFLKDKIKNYIKHCEICQKTKQTQPERLGSLHYLTPSRPNELITTDITGPFVLTNRNNKYIQ